MDKREAKIKKARAEAELRKAQDEIDEMNGKEPYRVREYKEKRAEQKRLRVEAYKESLKANENASNGSHMNESAFSVPPPEASPLREKILDKNPERRCVAIKYRTGEQCRNFAISGGTVCKYHGGATQHVRNAARIRVENNADKLMRVALEFAYDESKSEAVRLKSIQDLLDRAGLKPTTEVAVGVGHITEFERVQQKLFDSVATVTREDSRAARGLEDDERLSLDEIKRYQRIENYSGSDDLTSNSCSNFDPTAPVDDAQMRDDDRSQHAAPRPQVNAEPRYPYGAGDCGLFMIEGVERSAAVGL